MRTKLDLAVAVFLAVGCGDGGGQHFGDDAGTGTGGAAGALVTSTGGAGGEAALGTGGTMAASGGAGTGGAPMVPTGGVIGGLGGHPAGTGGAANSGGRGGAAGAPSSATGGRPGTGGAPGSGGRPGSGGAASGGAAGTGGRGSGGSGTGGAPVDLCPSSPCGSSDYCCRLPGQAPFCTPNVQGSACTLPGTGGMTASGGELGSGGAGTGGAGGVVGTGGAAAATGGAGGSAPVPWCQATTTPGLCSPGPGTSLRGHWCGGTKRSLPGPDLQGLVCYSGCVDFTGAPYTSDCFTADHYELGADGCQVMNLICVLDCGECS